MNEEEKYDLIEKYLSGQLTTTELQDFEKKLAVDEISQAEVKLHEELLDTLKGEKTHELRSTLKQVNQKWKNPEVKKEAKTRAINYRNWLTLAATMALFVVAYFLLQPNSISNQQLFADNFESYPMVLNQRSGNTTDSLLNEAINAYDQSDFATAVQQFQALQIVDNSKVVYSFYEGISLLGLQNTNAATSILEKIKNSNEPKWAEQSQWYLALAYLQKDEIDSAKKALQNIKKGQFQYVKAQELLTQLF